MSNNRVIIQGYSEGYQEADLGSECVVWFESKQFSPNSENKSLLGKYICSTVVIKREVVILRGVTKSVIFDNICSTESHNNTTIILPLSNLIRITDNS